MSAHLFVRKQAEAVNYVTRSVRHPLTVNCVLELLLFVVVMATSSFHGSGSQSPTSLTRTIEKVFDESQYTGEINLSGRKLKEYPKCACKYDLVDTTSAGNTGHCFVDIRCILSLSIVTGPPTHSVGCQYCFACWVCCHRLSSVVVCNTPRWRNVTHQGQHATAGQ